MSDSRRGCKGANRTGRPFTGDYAGELLYGSLKRHGLARGTYGARSDDGFELVGRAHLECGALRAAGEQAAAARDQDLPASS